MARGRQAVSVFHLYLVLSAHLISVCEGARPAASLLPAAQQEAAAQRGASQELVLTNNPIKRSVCLNEAEFDEILIRIQPIKRRIQFLGLTLYSWPERYKPPEPRLCRQDATVGRYRGLVSRPLDNGWIGFLLSAHGWVDKIGQIVKDAARAAADYITKAGTFLGPVGLVLTGVQIGLDHKHIQDLKRELKRLNPDVNEAEIKLAQCKLENLRKNRFANIVSLGTGILTATGVVASCGALAAPALSITLTAAAMIQGIMSEDRCKKLQEKMMEETEEIEEIWRELENPRDPDWDP